MCTIEMTTKRYPRYLYGLVLAILFASPRMILSQGYFGTVTGAVADPTGAAVPGVSLTLVDQQKGFTFHVISNKEGSYLFPSIPPGTYIADRNDGRFCEG